MTTTASGTRLGYVRVSTGKQDETLQRDALDAAKVLKSNRYADHGVNGSKTSRPGLDPLLADAEPGGGIVVYKLDRLGRSTAPSSHHRPRRVSIESIQDGLNSSTPNGRTMVQMLAIFAEMERSFIVEGTVAGLAAAKAQGRIGGWPKTENAKVRKVQALRSAGASVPEIPRMLGLSVATVHRLTKAA